MSPATPLPSNRSFGALFFVVFSLLGAYRAAHGHRDGGLWLGAAGLTMLVLLLRPNWLTPFNAAWMGLAAILHRITSPLILGFLYFGLFTPAGMVMKAIGRDVLLRRFDPAARTYWVDRTPPGPDPSGLPNQY